MSLGRLVQRCRECPRSNSCLDGVILLVTLAYQGTNIPQIITYPRGPFIR